MSHDQLVPAGLSLFVKINKKPFLVSRLVFHNSLFLALEPLGGALRAALGVLGMVLLLAEEPRGASSGTCGHQTWSCHFARGWPWGDSWGQDL